MESFYNKVLYKYCQEQTSEKDEKEYVCATINKDNLSSEFILCLYESHTVGDFVLGQPCGSASKT